MTVVFLVRHAAHARVHDTLSGRTPGVGLSGEGRAQAARLADRLARERITAVYTSPVQRARETAEPIAARLGLAPRIDEDLIEIDFGAWMGRTFESLAADPSWRLWNEERATARTPAGDSMGQVQARMRRALARLHERDPESGVVCVSHGDVIKAALADVLGLSLDAHLRLEISPASISAVALHEGGARVLSINEVPA